MYWWHGNGSSLYFFSVLHLFHPFKPLLFTLYPSIFPIGLLCCVCKLYFKITLFKSHFLQLMLLPARISFFQNVSHLYYTIFFLILSCNDTIHRYVHKYKKTHLFYLHLTPTLCRFYTLHLRIIFKLYIYFF